MSSDYMKTIFDDSDYDMDGCDIDLFVDLLGEWFSPEELGIGPRLKELDWTEEFKRDMITGNGFIIKQKATDKFKNILPEGIHSPKFGTTWSDENAFQERYRCECGELIGKLYEGEVCPKCHTKVKFNDVNLDIFGWMCLLHDYYIIQPAMYKKIYAFIGKKNLPNILDFKYVMNKDGYFEKPVEQDKQHPFYGIGMYEFRKRFDEIMLWYYNKKKQKKDLYENNVKILRKEVVEDYFDLNRDYKKIKEYLSKIDDNMKKSVEYGKGIRILNQDLWETIISFIISANNNIPRIKGIIERLSKNYGEEIEYNGEKYYTFPTAEELKDVSVEKYRELGLGFRDIRLYETTKMILNGEVDLDNLRNNLNTMEVRNKLLTLSGVGPKVADCILLFSDLKRFEVFPIDVWVRRVMNDLYIKNEDETKVNKKQIEKIAKEKFGNLAGLAQQYLFYWRREA